MFQSHEATELNQRYQAGERSFRNIQLRRLDLRGIDLRNADLRGADLSYSNLRDVNLSGANLSEAYLNEADLTGANLQGANLQNASLIKTYLIKTNLQQANLEKAYLTGIYGTKANFQDANLKSAYLNKANLTGANLQNAQYNEKTCFEKLFDPIKSRMKKVEKDELSQSIKGVNKQTEDTKLDGITVNQLLGVLTYIINVSNHYLGQKMTIKYWQSSRPEEEWLIQFQIDKSGVITFSGDVDIQLTSTQLQLVREWLKTYIKSCSQIFPGFSQMIDRQKVGLVFPPFKSGNNPNSLKGYLNSQKGKTIPNLLKA